MRNTNKCRSDRSLTRIGGGSGEWIRQSFCAWFRQIWGNRQCYCDHITNLFPGKCWNSVQICCSESFMCVGDRACVLFLQYSCLLCTIRQKCYLEVEQNNDIKQYIKCSYGWCLQFRLWIEGALKTLSSSITCITLLTSWFATRGSQQFSSNFKILNLSQWLKAHLAYCIQMKLKWMCGNTGDSRKMSMVYYWCSVALPY